MAEGVESIPSDALLLSLSFSPRIITVIPNYLYASREIIDISFTQKTYPPFFPSFCRGEHLDIRYRPFFLSFLLSRGYTPHHPLSFFRPFSLALPYYRHIGRFSIPLARVCIYTFVFLTRSNPRASLRAQARSEVLAQAADTRVPPPRVECRSLTMHSMQA